MSRDNALWLALGLVGGALLLIIGLPLIFMLTMGGSMMSSMIAPMFLFATPLVLVLCLIMFLPLVVIGAAVYAISRDQKPATQ